MTVSLRKGQGVSLRKNEFDLSSVTIGLGWDINEEKKVFSAGFSAKKRKSMTLMSSPSFATTRERLLISEMLKTVNPRWLMAILSSLTVFAINLGKSG